MVGNKRFLPLKDIQPNFTYTSGGSMNKKLMRICASGTALAVTASVLSLSVYAAPAKYSAVEQGYITSVKNQGNWGICWAFSSTAISEASLLSLIHI